MAGEEQRLIREFFSWQPCRGDVVLGPGDDAAVVQVPENQELVLSLDALVADRHFDADTPAADVGWKSVAVNLSDLAAMGAEPAWITLALTVPDANETWLKGFAEGLRQACAHYGVDLVGGDLTRGPLSITVQAQGLVPKGSALTHGGAVPGDLVCVTGNPGDAALALARRGELAGLGGEGEYLHKRLNRPMARVSEGVNLRGRASACVDLSDGLAADLSRILKTSEVGAVLELPDLPRSAAFSALLGDRDPIALQLGGGDDYELCFTLPETRLESTRAGLDAPVTVIGTILDEPGLLGRDAGGNARDLSGMGYDHFAQS